ncbi:MAG: metal ABC transporter permease [Actinomycetota bacterium]
MGSLIDPFLDNEFMVRALVAGVLVSLACAVIGTYVVLRGMAFIGDALAHGVLPGVALSLLVGVPTLLGAALGAGVMIGGVGLVTKRSRLSSDSAIGLLFIGLLALGVVMVSSSDSLGTSLEAILFGEFLGVDNTDLVVQATAAVVVGLVAVWAARPFLLLCFDRDQAKVMGFRADAYHRLMLVLVAGTIVVSFQTVGSLLVFGMLLAPAGVGALVARRVGVMMLWAALTGSLATYIGLLLSYHYAWAAGASVVLVAVAMFFVVLLITSFRARVGARA